MKEREKVKKKESTDDSWVEGLGVRRKRILLLGFSKSGVFETILSFSALKGLVSFLSSGPEVFSVGSFK